MDTGDNIKFPVKHGFQGVPVSDSETAHLQHLVYKAKFAEQISNDMRVPARIAFDENPKVVNDFIRSDSQELMLHHMKVPARITLTGELSPQRTLDKIDEIDRPVELKTPPRNLRLNDDRYSESNENAKSDTTSINKSPSLENINERYLTETDPNKNLKDMTKSESMNLDTPEIAALVEILKPEDQNSRVVRQQFFRLFRRITRLEKRECELQEALDQQKIITLASLGAAVLAVGISIISSQRSIY